MISAAIKDVKNNLSRLLARVKAGEEVVITERGRAIARIVKEQDRDNSVRAVLVSLVQKGLIALPSRSILKDGLTAVDITGKPVSEMVIEDRR